MIQYDLEIQMEFFVLERNRETAMTRWAPSMVALMWGRAVVLWCAHDSPILQLGQLLAEYRE